MGETLFRDFVRHCRTEAGYAALKSVVTKEKSDSMQSFLFAETFKYFYLLFSPPRTLNFNKVILQHRSASLTAAPGEFESTGFSLLSHVRKSVMFRVQALACWFSRQAKACTLNYRTTPVIGLEALA